MIAGELGISERQFSISFQSRLTRGWIRPFTDERVSTLAREGIKDLVIFCPSFVADCLETLEEVEMGLREKFFAEGGRSFALVESLNDADIWVESAASLVKSCVRQ